MYKPNPYYFVVMAAHKVETHWPPDFPPQGTLMTPSDYPSIPVSRESWGESEWKAYALFLEDHGRMFAKHLAQTREMVSNAQSKLSRSKKHHSMSLLNSNSKQPNKVGRKPNEQTRDTALKVLAIREELSKSGQRITDKQALEEHYKREGFRALRASEKPARHILNTVSKLRKYQKNSKHQLP